MQRPTKWALSLNILLSFCFFAQNKAEAKLITENKLRKFKSPSQLKTAVLGDIHFIEVKEV